ncbi:MAG TPA: diguanylate cyclase [Burkholderiaceae bacterium]|nr:diguanylate cyclase [Burkholderiaceae bacterium]
MISNQRRLRNALGVSLIVTICVVVALLLQRSRERAIDDLRRDTRSLTAALALYTGGVVTNIDFALVGARDSLALLEFTERGSVRADLGSQVLRSSVERIGLPVLMRVLDADGHQLFSSDAQPYAASSRDRDFFQAHVAHDAGLFISQIFVSRINGKLAMVFSRRINGPQGQFKGVILVGTPIEVFENLFQRFEAGSQGTVILADDSGMLLARRPSSSALVGKKILRDDGALAQLRSGVNVGVRINKAPVDGVQRMLGFERVGATRLVVGVGQSVDEWLAPWRREAAVAGTVTLLFAALALWLLARTTRHAKDSAARAAQLERSEERIRSILAHASDAFIGMDHRGLITEWNQQAEATFGWGRAGVLGRSLAEVIIPPRMRDSHNAGLQKFVHTGTGPLVNQRIELMALHRDGHEVPVELSVGALGTPDGFVAHAFLHDISERKRAQARLAASNRLLRDIADNLPLLISYIDKELRLRFCNATWREWMGIDPASAVGRPLSELIGPTLYEERSERLQRALAGERVSFEAESVTLGVDRYLHTVYIPDVQVDGHVAGIYALSTDVTASKQVEMQLSQLAHVDALTGLPNRRQFEEKLQGAVARSKRSDRPMALMFLDVDHFKQINDSHGHAAGDAVLKEFAARLQRCVRITDTVARLAGDEFVIILEGLQSAEDAELVARKIAAALHPPIAWEARTLSPVTSSIGVVVLTGNDVAVADVVARADEALYQAKRAGRDTFVVSHW